MQNDEDFFSSQPGPMDTNFDLSFATPSAVDMFSFSMAAPATAPAYINTQSFWDPNSSMTDFTMPIPFMDQDPFAMPQDWQGQQMPQLNEPLFHTQQQQAATVQPKQRPLMAKPPTLAPRPSSSNQNMSAFSQNQAHKPISSGMADTNSMPSFNTLGSPFQPGSELRKQNMKPSKTDNMRGNIPPVIAIPSNPFPSRIPSPSKMNRPSVRRAASDVQKKAPRTKTSMKEEQPPPNFAGKGRYSAGTASVSTLQKMSPAKEQNLSSIPETAKFNPRTSVTFSIDEFGRARTETTVIIGEDKTSRPRNARQQDDEISGSSTDEETLIIPSRRNSFNPSTRDKPPRTTRFDTIRPHSRRAAEYTEEARRSGDAARALKRVVENRRKSISGIAAMPPSGEGVTIRIQSSRDRERERERAYRRRSYASSNAASSNWSGSPRVEEDEEGDTDVDMDLEMVDTPETERSEGVRCVCDRRERADGEFLVLCGSCEHLLHGTCINIRPDQRTNLYICAYCAQTPNVRGGSSGTSSRGRDTVILDHSPLGHKGFGR